MKLTKRIISLIMAMLMLCSGMVVTAFADGETTKPYTITENNCKVDVEKVRIIVTAATVVLNEGEEAVKIEFTAIEKNNDKAEALEANYDKDGNTIFPYPVTGKTYIVEGFVNGTSVTNKFEIEVLNSQAAPAAPVAKKVTSTSIEINSVSTCEYRIDGGDWQASNVFTDLEPSTAYKIEMRYKKSATHYASDAVAITVRTLNPAGTNYPDEIFLVDKTEKTLTVEAQEKHIVEHEDGYYYYYTVAEDVEYSIDNGKTWQTTGAFTGLKADTTYIIVARYTHDKTVQEANPASEPKEFITNARENYPADLKKCTFKADDGDNYANESISITVVADTAPAKYDAQYGDTRYVPVGYTVSGLTDTFKFVNPSKDGKTYTSTFVPGDANANKTVEVKVYYQKEKCHGEDDNGNAVWESAGEIETKTYKVKVGEVHTFFTDVKNFFLDVFNALFNTIPAAINEWLGGFDFNGAMEGISGLLDMLGGMDLGGLTGETK